MLCKKFSKLANTSKSQEQQSADPYPWLAEDDERRNLTERYWRNILIRKLMFNTEGKGGVNGHAI